MSSEDEAGGAAFSARMDRAKELWMGVGMRDDIEGDVCVGERCIWSMSVSSLISMSRVVLYEAWEGGCASRISGEAYCENGSSGGEE